MSLALKEKLKGDRHIVNIDDGLYPEAFFRLKDPPERLYAIGNLDALDEGMAIVGARLATPYGLGCASRFARIASEAGLTIISGGAIGCDSAAHRATLSTGGKTVAFLGGGCDEIYPAENTTLFQQIIDAGGLVVSENEWTEPPLRHHFRKRNRLMASLAKATLIVEAGLPSGTFSTADEAIAAGREVLVVPGAITSKHSHGANRLIYQGAVPVIDDESFIDQVRSIFDVMILEPPKTSVSKKRKRTLEDALYDMVCAEPCTSEKLLEQVDAKRASADNIVWLMQWLSEMQREGRISRYPDGTYGAVVA